MPAEQRGLSMVFQSYAIWPHMTVFDNVAYGLRVRNESGAPPEGEGASRARTREDGRRMPSATPRSSPAASSSAWRWRAPARSRRRCCCSTSRCPTSTPSCAPRCASSCASCSGASGVTSLYVTHDLEEALAMSDQIVVMRTGNDRAERHAGRDLQFPAHGIRRRFRRLGQSHQRRGCCRSDDRAGRVAVEVAGGNMLLGVTHGRPVGPRGRRCRCAPCICGLAQSGPRARQRLARAGQTLGVPRRPDASACGVGRPGARCAPDRAADRRCKRGCLSPCDAEPMRLARNPGGRSALISSSHRGRELRSE